MNLQAPATTRYLARDLERSSQRLGRDLREIANLFNPGATRTTSGRVRQLVQSLTRSRSGYLHAAVVAVADPSREIQLLGLLDNKPAKSNSLHPSADLEVNRVHLR